MVIGFSFIGAIGGYFIHGCWWLLMAILLMAIMAILLMTIVGILLMAIVAILLMIIVTILLMDIGDYFINGYWCLLLIIILVVISAL